MKHNQNDRETVVMHYNRYSAWTVIKVIIFCFLIAFIMNTGSYGLVGYNHWASKAIGLASDAVEFCQQCLQALN